MSQEIIRQTTNAVVDRILDAVESEEEGAVLADLLYRADLVKKCPECQAEHRQDDDRCLDCKRLALRAEAANA